MRINASSYQRVLGDELRRVRKQRGWTRKELQHRLDNDISLQTLATYELGTRQCSVVRLAELCLAMDVLPHDVLARVHDRVFSDDRPGHLRVNLAKVVADPQPELLPLRRWAADRLQQTPPGQPGEIHLDLAALEQMAELCGLDTVELISRLRAINKVS
ncbi:MAG TPA: helix-turn-helix transcriptional regulator [Pseudonocardiaceae bacterium]|nr:helix-turn-helix transcriptional regulator [Pseudonocardiaceae bacterium]